MKNMYVYLYFPYRDSGGTLPEWGFNRRELNRVRKSRIASKQDCGDIASVEIPKRKKK